MGFTLTEQFSGNVPGLGFVEAGLYDISSGSRTCEVPTRLTTVNFGLGIADTDSADAQNTLVFTTDCAITSSAVTFKRHGPYISEDVRFRYIMIGW